MTRSPRGELVTHCEQPGHRAAIVFLHGFSGDPARTWWNFPKVLAGERRLQGWNVYSLGYSTGYWLDLAGVWKADPPLETLADSLRTRCAVDPLRGHESLALIAHSMGGLVIQRALLDDPALARRTSHVLLFGTPSGGLVKAGLFRFWKRQLRDMGRDGRFIVELRARWNERFGRRRPFRFHVVAGAEDEFVPRRSSIDPFPAAQRHVIPGDHLSLVHVNGPGHPAAVLTVRLLTARARLGAPGEAAGLEVERKRYRAVLRRLRGRKGLDADHLVELALALDGLGQRDEAIAVLEERLRGLTARERPHFTEAMGALAGRYKQRWWLRGSAADARRALTLYRRAHALARTAPDLDPRMYLGINLAFMELAFAGDAARARQLAQEVLQACAAGNGEPRWRRTAAAQALLILGRRQEALEAYAEVLRTPPVKRSDQWRQNLVTYQQAVRVTSVLGDVSSARRLEALFRSGG